MRDVADSVLDTKVSVCTTLVCSAVHGRSGGLDGTVS